MNHDRCTALQPERQGKILSKKKKSVTASSAPKGLNSLHSLLENEVLSEKANALRVLFAFTATPGKCWNTS